MTALIKNSEHTLAEIESFQAKGVPQFEAKEPNSAKGSFTFQNFLVRRNELEFIYSDPILADGHIFMLKLFPNGWS